MRELLNTLRRAAIWSDAVTIRSEDAREALLPAGPERNSEVLNRSLGEGLDLPAIMASVARHYLRRALNEAQGNKTQAATLVGLPSYQTLSNWLRRVQRRVIAAWSLNRELAMVSWLSSRNEDK